jgi:mRNA interferase MazF
MTDKLIPVRRDRVRRVIGKLEAEALAALDRALLVVLGLAE